jgi:L-serine/L-threonine ammonia-lyase
LYLSTSAAHVRSDLIEAEASIGAWKSGDFRCFLKLETQQASGSFKDRGLFHLVNETKASSTISKLISSSGGNAGNAVATVGKMLGIETEVFVPTTTMALMVEKIEGAGARVTIGGENWNAADKEARKAVEAHAGALYCPPFDHPLIWEGNSSMVEEIAMQIKPNEFPDAIILSVGGGGLLRGVQLGLEKLGFLHTKVIAVETEGADCFAKAPHPLISIDSIATSLGSLYVVEDALTSPIETISMVVSDQEAVDAAFKYAKDYRTLVEPACGAALAALNPGNLWKLKEMGIQSAVVVVCGGSAVSIDLLMQYRAKAQAAAAREPDKGN